MFLGVVLILGSCSLNDELESWEKLCFRGPRCSLEIIGNSRAAAVSTKTQRKQPAGGPTTLQGVPAGGPTTLQETRAPEDSEGALAQ